MRRVIGLSSPSEESGEFRACFIFRRRPLLIYALQATLLEILNQYYSARYELNDKTHPHLTLSTSNHVNKKALTVNGFQCGGSSSCGRREKFEESV